MDQLTDLLYDRIPAFLDDLLTEKGGVRRFAGDVPDLIVSTDTVWMKYSLGLDEITGSEGMIRFIQDRQDPETGRFSYLESEIVHSDGHAFWQTLRALNLLGADILYSPRYLDGVLTPEGLEAWFDGFDWSSRESNHHDVLGLAPLVINMQSEEYTETFYRKIDEQQDPETGTWPAGLPVNISRTYAYSILQMAAGRIPSMSDKIIDSMLDEQRENGSWDDIVNFHSMDACFLLVRLAPVTGYKAAESRSALKRYAECLEKHYDTSWEWYRNNIHALQSYVHSTALLQEAGIFGGEHVFRFGWDHMDQYSSETIKAYVQQGG